MSAWPTESEPIPGVTGARVEREFFDRDPREAASELLGTILLSRAGGGLTGGRIVETEAYLGSDDPGSHAATRGITVRNAVMYGPPGSVYVYFTYGNHHMLNLVCGPEGVAGAVLIRALEPLVGVGTMRARRPGRADHELTNGPGKLASALGVDLTHNGGVLGEGDLAVYHASGPFNHEVSKSGRVGLGAGFELELRYFLTGSPYVSRGRTGPPTQRRSRAHRHRN
ncbi:MAG: DNA-3-methyladenine glycosylase [Clostridiales bacterium]|nr:DNA-3-methyladenine glycosylase [Clostridiales bacterium]